MSKFKRNLQEKKKTIKHDQKQINQTTRYFISISFICLFILSTIILVLYFTRKSDLSINTQNKQPVSSGPANNPISDPNNQPELNVKIVENTNGTAMEILFEFYDVFTCFESNLSIRNKTDFINKVEEFAQTISTHAYNYYLNMKRHVLNIEDLITNSKDIQVPVNKIEQTNYNNVLFEYSNMLYVGHKQFITSPVKYRVDPESMEIFNITNNRFIYQYLHLHSILVTTINVIDNYITVIVEKIKEYKNDKKMIILTKNLFSQYLISKKLLFKLGFNKQIGFEYEHNFIIEANLMTNYKEYDRLIMINLFICFLHIFEINERFEVINVSDYFGIYFLNNSDVENINIKTARKEEVLKMCSKVFDGILTIDKEVGFDNMNLIEFEGCCSCVFENFC